MAAYILILVVLIFSYLLLKMLMHTLPEVEAGPTANVKSTGSRHIGRNIPASYRVSENGKSVIHRHFVVRGECMKKEGFNEGDIVDVRIFDKEERADIKNHISENDIVLIRLNDRNFRGYKLRIVRSLNDDDAVTYYYDGESVKDSSKPHKLKDIIGVVKRA